MICNDPAKFREELVAGFVAAYPQYVMSVPGGVVRTAEKPKGCVAVVDGGGSGHFPAFGGVVGEGFMDGTAIGNVFTSPSVDDMYSVAKTVENGGGVLILAGHHAGDKMNFNLARDRLRAEGIDARTFYVTDDLASAPAGEREKRRGNVGTFMVFKTAGAAAAADRSLDEVERLVMKCNDRTRTMSVGLHGCTLPGHAEPLFHVPAGKMEVGQGIHGEAGVAEDDVRSAAEIATLLVERILSEKPADAGPRVAVILDGLGATSHEELFVIWKTVSELLRAQGFEIVDPQVGELVTSLDMAGLALSVTFLDDELEALWRAPADTPAFRKGACAGVPSSVRRVLKAASDAAGRVVASDESRKRAVQAVEAFRRVAMRMAAQEGELARLDAVAGDGDHGRGMTKGSANALASIERAVADGAGLGGALLAAGRGWAQAGGTSGVLLGQALESAARTFDDSASGSSPVDWNKAIAMAVGRILELGQAKVGDKTMVDALVPFADEFARQIQTGADSAKAFAAALSVAGEAAQATRDLVAKLGRARAQAQRSLGTPDPGAVSVVQCLSAIPMSADVIS